MATAHDQPGVIAPTRAEIEARAAGVYRV